MLLRLGVEGHSLNTERLFTPFTNKYSNCI